MIFFFFFCGSGEVPTKAVWGTWIIIHLSITVCVFVFAPAGDICVPSNTPNTLWFKECCLCLFFQGEFTFSGDKLIEGGLYGEMTNGIHYREVRQYQTDFHLVRFYFVTRCYNAYVESILTDMAKDPQPDVILMNSCLWDISRYIHTMHIPICYSSLPLKSFQTFGTVNVIQVYYKTFHTYSLYLDPWKCVAFWPRPPPQDFILTPNCLAGHVLWC